jgi:peptide/nickel transport system permease protein
MSRAWWLAKRLAVAIVVVYLIMTAVFAFIALTDDPTIHMVERAAVGSGISGEELEAVLQSYRESRNLNDPIHERYVNWLINVATLDWGRSFSTGQAVAPMVGRSLLFTAAYLVPALVLSVGGGIAIGMYSATHDGSIGGRIGVGLSYFGFGVPNFLLAWLLMWLVAVELHLFGRGLSDIAGTWSLRTVGNVALAAIVAGSSILAGQIRYARSESLEHLGKDFVKLLRAKGAGPRTVTRHVLRNAAGPIVATAFTELVDVMLVAIIVIERIFGIPGIGDLIYQGVFQRDLPLLIGAAMALAFLTVGGTLFQDLLHASLDPTVDHAD